MKNTALFVNVGRGPIVDTDALINALKTGEIDYAALDVTDPEPLPADHPLWMLRTVLLYHILVLILIVRVMICLF